MEPIKPYSLEEFTERHRADFDLHEPRPELWDVLATQLDADADARPGTPRMHIAPATLASAPAAAPLPLAQPVLRTRRVRWQYGGVALALAALLIVAGLGEKWKAAHAPVAVKRPGLAGTHRAAPDAALYLAADAGVLPASQGSANGNARLDTAVHGMERYYAAQLLDRQTQLSQLAPDTEAEWAVQLVSLDSSYQQLKRELPQHPQPEAVLTAMNRNLQIRLDILDRQLELRGAGQLARTPGTLGGEYTLADSRSVADNPVPQHVR